uniref:Uncharacterized protein n=2 Tax=Hemiselmis andersenii TaxID=464988 RepID=A0A6U2CUM2_HEMAN|mmetsp:Transcript_2084/g.4686  ORF Transcript_2084/g.4686 Transcript_2084/m.4686 type:complete len:113 (+) Transcript_2084:67-405(+)|eukprot:CAMPEP_0114128088 /NCGR_PEP_ID=MMETSP0043_2-20121206/10741_1 /TAXON_ID=464988 /ORGANISM="Hemiselmis andersenii, Strain CCMP644" /LENGTH=112 /DNA_ID=CAMNT_0001221245 /DNA_START=64 /DNA_END=402 /DNA_ORIENTATION=-
MAGARLGGAVVAAVLLVVVVQVESAGSRPKLQRIDIDMDIASPTYSQGRLRTYPLLSAVNRLLEARGTTGGTFARSGVAFAPSPNPELRERGGVSNQGMWDRPGTCQMEAGL